MKVVQLHAGDTSIIWGRMDEEPYELFAVYDDEGVRQAEFGYGDAKERAETFVIEQNALTHWINSL